MLFVIILPASAGLPNLTRFLWYFNVQTRKNPRFLRRVVEQLADLIWIDPVMFSRQIYDACFIVWCLHLQWCKYALLVPFHWRKVSTTNIVATWFHEHQSTTPLILFCLYWLFLSRRSKNLINPVYDAIFDYWCIMTSNNKLAV